MLDVRDVHVQVLSVGTVIVDRLPQAMLCPNRATLHRGGIDFDGVPVGVQ